MMTIVHDEWAAFGPQRHARRWRAGQIRRIRQAFHRRTRRAIRRELRLRWA
jgi:hypothetical protein